MLDLKGQQQVYVLASVHILLLLLSAGAQAGAHHQGSGPQVGHPPIIALLEIMAPRPEGMGQGARPALTLIIE